MNRVDQGRRILRKAEELRERIRQNIAANRFRDDDIQMDSYNALVEQACNLFLEDPVLNGQLVRMPDQVLQGFQYPWGNIRDMLLDMPSKRLEERLTILIDRLEFVLGRIVPSVKPAVAATGQKDADVVEILEKLEALEQAKKQLPVPEARSFDFVVGAKLRQVLVLDYQEAQMDFAAGSYESAAILFRWAHRGYVDRRVPESGRGRAS